MDKEFTVNPIIDTNDKKSHVPIVAPVGSEIGALLIQKQSTRAGSFISQIFNPELHNKKIQKR